MEPILEHPAEGHDPSIGGKARNLIRLHRAGMPVPEFFCIPGRYFTEFVAPVASELDRVCVELGEQTAVELDRTLARVLSELEDRPLPDALSTEIRRRLGSWENGPVSVRSSAAAEDTRRTSFAGILETLLFVPHAEVEASVRACWLGALSPRSFRYCATVGIRPSGLAMGIVVQEMVASRASGVLFTANPVGSLEELLIVAGYGVGEGVVEDRVETDRYRQNRTTGRIEAVVAHKTERVVRDDDRGSGTRVEEVDDALRDTPVLTLEHQHALFAMGMAIEALYGEPQDVEWALDDAGELFVLQARPVTTLLRGRTTLFDNSNIVESYPRITSPLTFSIVRRFYAQNFGNTARKLGVPKRVLRRRHDVFENLVGYLQGRVYYNLGHWYAMFSLMPGVEGTINTLFEDAVGVDAKRPESSSTFAEGAVQTVRIAAHLVERLLTMPLRMRWYKRGFVRLHRRLVATDLSAMSTHDLVSHFHQTFAHVIDLVHLPLINDFLLILFSGGTKAFMARSGVEEVDDVFNGLLAGLEGMESVLPVQSMVDLGELLRADLALFARVKKGEIGPGPLREILGQSSASSPFWGAFRRHLEEYGDRCPEELKLSKPGFREEPHRLLQTVFSYADSGLTAREMKDREARIRQDAEARLASGIRARPIARLLVPALLAKTRELVRNRESARLDRARTAGAYRAIFAELGRRFVEEGSLERAEDLFYLTLSEVTDFVYGAAITTDIGGLVARRRADFEHLRTLAPCERMVFRGTVSRNTVPQEGVPAVEQGVLTGLGCAPGVVRGQVLVVEDPSTVTASKGRILVARMTDPGWVFLMVLSAGLVVEKGSPLSHTAIIGRELGIPTVVGVKNATTHLRTDDWVELDATRGTIRPIPAPAEG